MTYDERNDPTFDPGANWCPDCGLPRGVCTCNDQTTDKCPQCGSENTESVIDVSEVSGQSVVILLCQCHDCGEETVIWPEFPDYTGF